MDFSKETSQFSDKEMARVRREVLSPWRRLLRRAERQIDQGDYERAAAFLERATAPDGESYVCALRVANLYRTMQRWSAAFSAAEKAAALSPKRLPAYEMALAIALEAGDHERILAACHALIKRFPHHLPAYNALGAVHTQRGDVDAAMRAANTLIRLDPHNAAHHFKKALLCQHKGEVALAVQEFSKVLRLEPNGPHAAAAREALETLDSHQINQIAVLAMEDAVFRAKLSRDPIETVAERGFTLSDLGNQALVELCAHVLPDLPEPCRTHRYN